MLGNLIGRSRVRGKVFVLKHFPGGPPQLEFTEATKVIFKDRLADFFHLKPFRDLMKVSQCKAIMVSHGIYSGIEKDLSGKFWKRYDEPVFLELKSLGMTKANYLKFTMNRPASVSPIIIEGLLRASLNYNGFVLPDAQNMGGLSVPIKEFIELIKSSFVDAFTPNSLEIFPQSNS